MKEWYRTVVLVLVLMLCVALLLWLGHNSNDVLLH